MGILQVSKSKQDCKLAINAPGQRKIGLVSGRLLDLYQRQVSNSVSELR